MVISTVPTLLERQGIFTEAIAGRVPAVYDPATTAGSVRSAFEGNALPLARMDPVARALLQRYPLPNSAGTANNYRRTDSETDDQDQFDARLDHALRSNRDQLRRHRCRSWTPCWAATRADSRSTQPRARTAGRGVQRAEHAALRGARRRAGRGERRHDHHRRRSTRRSAGREVSLLTQLVAGGGQPGAMSSTLPQPAVDRRFRKADHLDDLARRGCARDHAGTGARDAQRLGDGGFDRRVGLAALGRRGHAHFEGVSQPSIDAAAGRPRNDLDPEFDGAGLRDSNSTLMLAGQAVARVRIESTTLRTRSMSAGAT